MRRLTSLLMILSTAIAAAHAASDMCVYPKGVVNGFDFAAYERCTAAIQRCPAGHIFRDEKCAAKKLKHTACKQLAGLAKHLDVDAQMISVEKTAKYATIKISFPADGGESFYILSPRGCLVDTNINPGKFDAAFKHQFASKDLYTEVVSAPVYSALPKAGKRFTVSIEGRDQCRACAVLVKTDVAFDFSKKDKLEKVVVLNQTNP